MVIVSIADFGLNVRDLYFLFDLVHQIISKIFWSEEVNSAILQLLILLSLNSISHFNDVTCLRVFQDCH